MDSTTTATQAAEHVLARLWGQWLQSEGRESLFLEERMIGILELAEALGLDRQAVIDAAGRQYSHHVWWDDDCNSEDWAFAARADPDAPPEVHGLLHGNDDHLIVSAEAAARIQRWASALPGWDDVGYEGARPLAIEEYDGAPDLAPDEEE